MIKMSLSFFGGGGSGGGADFPNTEGSEEKFVNNLDELLSNPKLLAKATPTEWFNFLKSAGHNPSPLSGGSKKGISFENGGGFKVTWGGDRLLQFHPGGGHHGSRAYWKISSGTKGTIRIDTEGNFID